MVQKKLSFFFWGSGQLSYMFQVVQSLTDSWSMKKKTKESSPELHKTSFSWKNQDMKSKWLPAFFVAKISIHFLGIILLKQPKPMMRNVFPNLPIHKAGRRIYRSLEGGSPGADFALLMRYCFLMCKNWSEYDFKRKQLGFMEEVLGWVSQTHHFTGKVEIWRCLRWMFWSSMSCKFPLSSWSFHCRWVEELHGKTLSPDEAWERSFQMWKLMSQRQIVLWRWIWFIPLCESYQWISIISILIYING